MNGNDNGWNLEIIAAVGLCLLVWLTAVVWLAALAAAAVMGDRLAVDAAAVVAATVRLFQSPLSPASALRTTASVPWWMFWPVVAVELAATAVLGRTVMRRWHRRSGFEKRKRFGVSPEAAVASAKQLAPLHVKLPVEHRLLLGELGGQLLATENRALTGHGSGRGAMAHRLDRGAVAYIGPSRVGKTSAVLTGVLEWPGPVVMCSVKDDMLDPTLAHRRRVGECVVFDPTLDLTMSYRVRQQEAEAGVGDDGPPAAWDEKLVCGWSPIGAIRNLDDAQRAARAVCEAMPTSGVEGGDFWKAQVEILMSGLMWVGAVTPNASMREVVRWVLTKDAPTPEKPTSEPHMLVQMLKDSDDPRTARDAVQVEGYLMAVWTQDPRTVSSVYASANTAVWPWTTDAVAASTLRECVSLDWLLTGNNTLYLCAPPDEMERLNPVYGGLINTLLGDAFRRVSRHGVIDPPLLMILDEAGNMTVDKLPTYTSTVAGLGIQLATLWQDIDQMEAAYKERANTVMNNHLTKMMFPAQSSKKGLEYIASLIGDEEVLQTAENRNLQPGSGGVSVNESSTRVQLAPPNVIRQMAPGDAVMIHGTLPPAHVKTLPYYAQPWLKDRMEWKGDDENDAGLPVSLKPELNDPASSEDGLQLLGGRPVPTMSVAAPGPKVSTGGARKMSLAEKIAAGS